MRGARRREQILQLLQTVESGALSVEEIAERFGVSFATVRRDLNRLRQGRHITRTYGGIALTGPAEQSIHQRHLEFTQEKDAIWQLYRNVFEVPASQVRPDDTDWTGAEIRACCRLAALLEVQA